MNIYMMTRDLLTADIGVISAERFIQQFRTNSSLLERMPTPTQAGAPVVTWFITSLNLETFSINRSWHPTSLSIGPPFATGKDASVRGSMDPPARQEQVGSTPASRAPARGRRGRGGAPWWTCQSAAASEAADAAQELLFHLQVKQLESALRPEA